MGGLATQNGLQPQSKPALKPLDKLECRTTLDWVSQPAKEAETTCVSAKFTNLNPVAAPQSFHP